MCQSVFQGIPQQSLSARGHGPSIHYLSRLCYWHFPSQLDSLLHCSMVPRLLSPHTNAYGRNACLASQLIVFIAGAILKLCKIINPPDLLLQGKQAWLSILELHNSPVCRLTPSLLADIQAAAALKPLPPKKLAEKVRLAPPFCCCSSAESHFSPHLVSQVGAFHSRTRKHLVERASTLRLLQLQACS